MNAASGRPTQMAAAATQFGNLFQNRPSSLEAPRTDSAHVPAFDTTSSQSLYTAYSPSSNNLYAQQGAVPAGLASDKVHAYGIPQSSHTPQQRTAAMQRGSDLIQELGQNLYQHHLASGMVDTTVAGANQSPRTQQYAGPPGTGYAPQAQMSGAKSHVPSQQLDDQLNVGSPVSPANFFHHNLNQARAAGATQGRSFSTGSVPLSGLPHQTVGGSPTSPSSFGVQQPPVSYTHLTLPTIYSV